MALVRNGNFESRVIPHYKLYALLPAVFQFVTLSVTFSNSCFFQNIVAITFPTACQSGASLTSQRIFCSTIKPNTSVKGLTRLVRHESTMVTTPAINMLAFLSKE